MPVRRASISRAHSASSSWSSSGQDATCSRRFFVALFIADNSAGSAILPACGLLRCLERRRGLLRGAMDGGELLVDVAREHELRRPLLVERDFRRHRPFGARTEHGDLERLPGLRDRRLGRGRLVAAMRHAVRAFLVAAGAVGILVGGLHQLAERFGVAFAEQIAGLLPAENVAGRHAPRGAMIGLVAGEEVEEQVRMDEGPALVLAARKDVAEQLLGLATIEKVLLVGGALVGVTGRDRYADAELLGVVEEGRDVGGGMAVVDGGVDVDGKSPGLGGLDRGDGAVEYALLADRFVVMLLEPVEVNGEEQIGRGLEQIELLLQEQRVGAERDEFPLGHDAFDDLADLLVDERLAARDRDHGRAAFVDRVEAFLDRQPAIEDRIGIIDLAAAEAGEVAAEQRLQHQHQRIAFAPPELLLEDIGADTHFLEERDLHLRVFLSEPFDCPLYASTPQAVASSRGSRNSICSSRPGRVETSTGPSLRSLSITSSTSTSGAEAPAVMPMVCACPTHPRSSSPPSAMR